MDANGSHVFQSMELNRCSRIVVAADAREDLGMESLHPFAALIRRILSLKADVAGWRWTSKGGAMVRGGHCCCNNARGRRMCGCLRCANSIARGLCGIRCTEKELGG